MNIEELKILADRLDGDYGHQDINQAVEAIDRLIEREKEWISVDDALPATCSGQYLVYGTSYSYTFTAVADYLAGWIKDDGAIITHWQPLPPTPADVIG